MRRLLLSFLLVGVVFPCRFAGAAEPLRGGVEQFDVARGWIPGERLGISEWEKRVAPKLKSGLRWSDNLLPQTNDDAVWVKIPDWLAGQWHIETAHYVRDVGPDVPGEVKNVEDDAFGLQQDKNGGYWHLLRVPSTNMTETEDHYARFIHHTLNATVPTQSQFILEGDNMELRVARGSNRIVSVRRRHDRYSWLMTGAGVEADDHVEYLDASRRVQEGSQGTVKARPTKTGPFKRVDKTADGFDARYSFIEFLKKNGLGEIAPAE